MRNYLQPTLLFVICLMAQLSFAQDYGTATYFADAFHGRTTSSGETYDKNKMTAAYKKYEYGDMLRVTRLDNKKSIVVRIIDRGPLIKNRLIELSRRAAERLDMIGEEDVEVKVELVSRASEATAANVEAGPEPEEEEITVYEAPEPERVAVPEPKKEPDPARTAAAPQRTFPASKTETPAPKKEKIRATAARPKVTAEAAPKATSLDEDAVLLRKGNFSTYDLYKVQVLRPQRKGYGVQVAYITNYENVLRQVAELQEKWFKNILISVEQGKNNTPVYRIILGPFPDQETATAYKKRLKSKKKINGFLVDLSTLEY
ncbi:MAG: septal ring lytic transglycosylase RlpA family protein [Bacteroidota bacterium]